MAFYLNSIFLTSDKTSLHTSFLITYNNQKKFLLIPEPMPKRLNNGYRQYQPDFLTIPGKTSLDNPEYIMSQDDGPLTPQPLGIPTTPNALDQVLANGAFGSVGQVRQRNSEEESDHEYYNDFDRLERELQPLKPLRKNETTV